MCIESDADGRSVSEFNVFIIGSALKLVSRTIIARRDEVKSTRCKYVAVAIVFMSTRK